VSRSQRQKGQRGELKVAEALRDLFPNARRNLNDFNEAQGVDLTDTGNLAVQVKHLKNHAPFSKYNEIRPTDGRIPVLVSWPTSRGTVPMVALSLEDFIKICKDVGEVY